MRKNAILNFLYTLGLCVSAVLGFQYGIEQKQYGYLIAAVILIPIFIVLKIRILKEVKNTLKP
jgi:hypothetical protein